ncbi:uncharacterized protein SPSK_10668 [Sporothrix schenckii 1099-18]|uniref:Uncharacterized protein n=1 Tax=Sporothrix schenckii 1099-18 TaxID=1397361 RepID=A0A0F2LUY2_SPOSC|nr:uncharacterized protein SPSK_10668 [Sporothrix schenckii 1099-18]KJR80649.1 hypothetical protein SPSK_10668 [Sporothrix schenckii 1099-18]
MAFRKMDDRRQMLRNEAVHAALQIRPSRSRAASTFLLARAFLLSGTVWVRLPPVLVAPAKAGTKPNTASSLLEITTSYGLGQDGPQRRPLAHSFALKHI